MWEEGDRRNTGLAVFVSPRQKNAAFTTTTQQANKTIQTQNPPAMACFSSSAFFAVCSSPNSKDAIIFAKSPEKQ